MANLQYNGIPLPDGVRITKAGTLRKRSGASDHAYSEGVCYLCGKRFIGPTPGKHFNWKHRYCSRQCSGKSRTLAETITTNGYPVENGIQVHLRKAEEALGRPLRKGECVHHINMDKTDNRNENLMICTREYHHWLHHAYERAFARTLA